MEHLEVLVQYILFHVLGFEVLYRDLLKSLICYLLVLLTTETHSRLFVKKLLAVAVRTLFVC